MRTRLPVRLWVGLLFCVTAILFSGCLRERPDPLTWSDILEMLADIDQVARLDTPGASLVSSTDPAGGDEDYNHFARKGPSGWVVLADLKGPGVMTRLWLTGAYDGSQRLRFYVDRAWRPTLEITLDELAGGREPFVLPLAGYENDSWYSLIPMPYRRRLVIMAEDTRGRPAGWSRLAYQINTIRLPRETRMESFTGAMRESDREALAELARAWSSFGQPRHVSGTRVAVGMLALRPGESRWIDPIRGPGVIRRLTVTPKFERIKSAMDRQHLLRDVLLQIRWDKAAAPSVEVPIGDFFGNLWNRVRYRSAFLSYQNDSWTCRFPMPFSTEAEIALKNQGLNPVEFEIEVVWEPRPSRNESEGYFHAAWSGSGPEDADQPHIVLDVRGRGKFVGCAIGTSSQDPGWRILEGDEWMRVDGEPFPRWRGTALNHYFNAGQVYQGPVARPFHGTLFRTFFGAIQYRLHAADAVNFDQSFQMLVERGASRAWMQSVAYYYMDRPQAAAFPLRTPAQRPLPQNALLEAAIMTELMNFERLGDYHGAREHIARYLERFPTSRYAAVLRLRQIAYTEALSGFDAAWPLYQQFLADETDEQALAQAKLLSWFLEDPSHALLCLHGSGRSAAVMGGTTICTVDGSERAAIVGIKIKSGRHCMAVQSLGPNWVQAALKMRKSAVSTQAGWKYAFDPSGDWGVPGYDDREWKTLDRTRTLAPPEEPFIWIEPHAFVGLQPVAAGLRPGNRDWVDVQGPVVFRREFDMP